MTSLEEGTWHESHLVWYLPPSASVHVTHGIKAHRAWITKCERNRKVRGSFLLLGSNQGMEKNSVEGEKRKGKRKERKTK